MRVEVLRPGFLSTIQDLGRPGWEHLGVSPGGVADPFSARVANRLVGNPDGCAVCENTVFGVRLRFEGPAWVSVCGGRFRCNIPLWRSVRVDAGFVLDVGVCEEGFRCYVAVGGGFESPRMLGSASVHAAAGFGVPLRRDDVLETGVGVSDGVCERSFEGVPAVTSVLRLTPGVDIGAFGGGEVFRLFGQEWRVLADSSRQGIRLAGVASGVEGAHGGKDSEGVALGAVQVLPGGGLAVLFVDAQTTGGYPVIGNVIAADQFQLAQARPGASVRFSAVSWSEAEDALSSMEALIQSAG